jgi:hypothetical protein
MGMGMKSSNHRGTLLAMASLRVPLMDGRWAINALCHPGTFPLSHTSFRTSALRTQTPEATLCLRTHAMPFSTMEAGAEAVQTTARK